MAARFGLRAALRTQPTTTSTLRFSRLQRRVYSDAATATAPKVEETAFTRFWNSPVGPKTVHFWAPIMKWGLVIAGAADFARPASQLSISQNAALMMTGAIWTRWCFVIKPRNLFLASVNALLFCVGATQVTRALLYQRSLKGEGAVEATVKEEGKDLETVIKEPGRVVEAVKQGK